MGEKYLTKIKNSITNSYEQFVQSVMQDFVDKICDWSSVKHWDLV